MPLLAVLLAVPVFASRIAVPRAQPRAAVPVVVPSLPALPLPLPAAQLGPAPAPSPESQSADFDALFSGKAKGAPWVELPGSPKVAVGSTLVDKRAPGAREILRSLTLPNDTPVVGLFKRDGERIVNGFALGTQGVSGHKDAVPPGADKKELGGYTLGLKRDGGLMLAGSGHLPAELTPRLMRNLKRYYGLSPALETGLERLSRWWFALWDGLSAFLRES
jgi:hypothetical protein